MPATDQSVLPLGAGTIALLERDRLLGLGFVGADTAGSMVQRWVLYPGYEGPPRQTITFCRAVREYASIAEWRDDLKTDSLWRAGSRYVKAEMDTKEQIIWPVLAIIYQEHKLVGWVSTLTSTPAPGSCTDLFTMELWTVLDDYVPPPVGRFELRAAAPGQDEAMLGRLFESRPSRTVRVNCSTYSTLPADP